VVPHSRRLLQAVEGLVEPTQQLRVSRVNEVGRLRAVDHLRECAVEEGILDVELVHGPTTGDSQSHHNPDGGRLDDGAEGLVVVHPRALSETRRTQRVLYRSREPSLLSLCLKIHLPVTMLAPGGRGIKSHVLLDSRVSYSSIARRQWGSASALWIEVGTGDSVGGAVVAESCRRSMGLVIPATQ
jgi:hypothetical protein